MILSKNEEIDAIITRKRVFVAMTLLLCLGLTESAYPLSISMASELNFFYGSQKQKGRLGKVSGYRITEYFSEPEARATFKALVAYKTAADQHVSQEIKDQKIDKVLFIIHKIETNFRAGQDIASDLKTMLSYRKSDGGWGHLKRSSTNFHTAHAVRVLNTVKYSGQKIIDGALDYLKSRQNTDGGWGFKKGDDSSGLMTAVVLTPFSSFKEKSSFQTLINKGTAYLLTNQNPDGSFSEKPRR